MTNVFRKFGLAAMVAFAVIAMFAGNASAKSANGDSAATPANSEIVNGWWDGTGAASAPGEMTLQIGSVFSGVHSDSTRDTLTVDSVFAFSSLESLLVADQSGGNYDTIHYQYIVQNYSNASDSFEVLINIVDTTNGSGHFPVTDLDVTEGLGGGDPVVSSATSGGAVDSIYYRFRLAEGAMDSFWIRVVIPQIDSAEDGDVIDVAVKVTDQAYSVGTKGVHDYWPDTLGGAYHTAGRIVVDTVGSYLHLGQVDGIDSCLLDFGDTQYDTVRLSITAATIRLAKNVTKIGWTYDNPMPGDTIQYTIKYDNDGSGATVDTAYIVDRLPLGVSFVELDSAVGGNGTDPIVEASYRGGAWSTTIANDEDSLRQITALRFKIPEGLGGDAGGDDNQTSAIANDSTGNDAGLIRFKVRVR